MSLIDINQLPVEEQRIVFQAIDEGYPKRLRMRLLSYGWTADYLPPKGPKNCTRRNWKPRTLQAWQEAWHEGRLWHRAISKNLGWGGVDIGLIRLSDRPYSQNLIQMPEADLEAEGGMCETVEEFAGQYFKSDLYSPLAVIRFDYLPIDAALNWTKSQGGLEVEE